MGVYINMEMPENCALCPMWDAGNCLTASEAIICEYDKRPQDCPLVPVPPHGRLIDANAAIADIRGEILEHQMNGMKGTPFYIEDLRTMWQRLEDEEMCPTIIPAEEVYGQYTDTAGNFHWCGTHSGEHTIKAKESEI